MSHLMPSEKLEEQLPKLIPGILALYKKHAEAFYISKVRSWGARSCCPGPVPDPGCASPWSPATAPGQGQLLGGSHTVPRGDARRCPPRWAGDRRSRHCSLPLGCVCWHGSWPPTSCRPPPSPPLTAARSLAVQSLCQILEASVNIGSRSLDVQLDALLGTLHPQVGVPWGWGVGLGSPWSGVVLVLSSVMGCEAHPALVLLLPPPSSSRRCWQPPSSGAGHAGVTWTAGVPLRVSSGCAVTRRGKTNLWGLADLSNSSLRVNKPGAGSTRGPLLGLPSLSPGS